MVAGAGVGRVQGEWEGGLTLNEIESSQRHSNAPARCRRSPFANWSTPRNRQDACSGLPQPFGSSVLEARAGACSLAAALHALGRDQGSRQQQAQGEEPRWETAGSPPPPLACRLLPAAGPCTPSHREPTQLAATLEAAPRSGGSGRQQQPGAAAVAGGARPRGQRCRSLPHRRRSVCGRRGGHQRGWARHRRLPPRPPPPAGAVVQPHPGPGAPPGVRSLCPVQLPPRTTRCACGMPAVTPGACLLAGRPCSARRPADARIPAAPAPRRWLLTLKEQREYERRNEASAGHAACCPCCPAVLPATLWCPAAACCACCPRRLPACHPRPNWHA